MLRRMDVNFKDLSSKVRYKLLTALVVPRPIAWVTTLNKDGSVNAAPYSFFNVMGNRPPIVALGPGDRPGGALKDTPQNIARQGEFVVNLVDLPAARAMHQTAAPFPAGTSEVEALSLATEPSTHVAPPRLQLSKVQLECRHWGTVSVEDNQVVFGVVEHLHIEDGLLDPETYQFTSKAFEGVGRLQGPGWYCTSADRFDLGGFPSVDDVLGKKDE